MSFQCTPKTPPNVSFVETHLSSSQRGYCVPYQVFLARKKWGPGSCRPFFFPPHHGRWEGRVSPGESCCKGVVLRRQERCLNLQIDLRLLMKYALSVSERKHFSTHFA